MKAFTIRIKTGKGTYTTNPERYATIHEARQAQRLVKRTTGKTVIIGVAKA